MQQGILTALATGSRIVVGAVAVIGRTPGCDVIINDRAASRRHMEITAGPEGFVWKDLGSANGTSINGRRMLGGELKHGDMIKIGETELRFEVEAAPDSPAAVAAPETAPAKLEPAAAEVKVSTELRRDGALFQEAILDSAAEEVATPASAKSAALLEAVYSVVNDIAQNYESCSLIDKILETTVRAIGAQRGALFLAGPDHELLPCPVCNKVHRIREGALQHAEPGEIEISRTVTRRVIEGGESVLYQDSDNDQELSNAASIMSLSLRSILCVPLRAKQGILGVLYIDTDRASQQYTRGDLLLASAVGNSAGIAMENARMHQEILVKQRMELEIATAWTIQEGFLVKEWPAENRRFDVYGETRPAKTVGGDFYDFVQPGKDVIGLLVGDVSGKGVPAALTMAQLLAQFRLHARDLESPSEVLDALNRDLVRRSQRGLFCTLCYLRLDLKTGEVVSANAGHNPVVRIGWQKATTFGDASGPPLGVVETAKWEDTYLKVEHGDTLLLYTDGVTEARRARTGDQAPEEFDEAGLMNVVGGQYGIAAKALLTTIQNTVREFCAPDAPHDDCTMIAVRYLGN